MTSVPFLFLSCSWISSPLLIFWPHNLIFSLQLLYLPPLATLPFLFPLSLLPYFHHWALSLHHLSPSSPPILICSSPWRKAQTFSLVQPLAVSRWESIRGASEQVVHPVELWKLKRLKGGTQVSAIGICTGAEKEKRWVSAFLVLLCDSLKLRNAAGEQLELLWVSCGDSSSFFVTVWRRKVEFCFLLFGRTGSELLQCCATKAKSDQQLWGFSVFSDTWFDQIQDIWPMQLELSHQFLSNNRITCHCILKPSEGDLWIVATLPKRIGAWGGAAVSCSLVGHKELNLIQLTLFVEIFGGSRWPANQMAQSMSVMSQLMTPPVCTLKCACKNNTLTGGCGVKLSL